MFRRPIFINPKLKAFLIIVVIALLIVKGFLFVERSLRPTILAIAEARAKIIAFDAINQAINERVAQNILYKDLVILEKDTDGNIQMAQTNTMEVNRVQAETVRRVQNTLKTIKGEQIKIPFGQVIGSQILANYGPRIPVNLVPLGTVHVEVSHSFKEAGINQTRHKIYLDVYADVQIVIPFVSASREVKTAIPVADTIFMGDVPDTVVNLPFHMKGGDGFSQGNSNQGYFGDMGDMSEQFNMQDGMNQFTQDGGTVDSDSGRSSYLNNLPYFNR